MGSYDVKLVALSYVVSVFGSYMALRTATRISGGTARDRWFGVVSAAFSMGGCGIWSMHFIGMIAFRMAMPVSYGVGLTVASLVLAIAVTGIGFAVVSGDRSGITRYAVAGTVMGLGISGMHYTGMAAMRMPAEISYSPALVALSIAIGVVASTAALWLCLHLERTLYRLGSALVMGVAVCGMHYTGMAAASFEQTDDILPLANQALAGGALAYLVFLFAIVILAVQIGVAAGRRAEQAAEGSGAGASITTRR